MISSWLRRYCFDILLKEIWSTSSKYAYYFEFLLEIGKLTL